MISNEVDLTGSRWVTSRAVNGHPAQVLIDASADADRLVVGCRGHSAFVEALLGSVREHCVHHARCPVLVIRGEPARAAAAGAAGLVVPGAVA